MPRGASAKREREYEELKKDFKKEGRYKGREEEVASRIVNKQRAQMGETKTAKAQDKKGQAPDANLPIKGYAKLTVEQVARRIGKLSRDAIKQLKSYEAKHKNRKTLLEQLNRQLKTA